MEQLKNVSWLRLVAAIGFVSGSLGCAAGGVATSAAPDGAAPRNAGTGGGGQEAAIAGGLPAIGGTGGSQASGGAGIGSPSNGGGGSGGGGASAGPDAAVIGAARDGGASDAAGLDGGSDAAADARVDPPGCAGSTFALCDDFESGVLDANVWTTVQSKGTATLDSSRGARGSKYSVHVHVDPGGDTMVGITESKTFPALKAGLFARAFIFIPGAMATSLFTGDRHSRLIYAQGETPYGEYALGIWNGGLIQNHYSDSDDSQDTKMLPPFDQWFCLEYELDSAQGNVKAYLNDVEVMELRHDGWPASNIDTLMFGVDRYGSFPVAEDIWFDDLVVDSARIGCKR